MTKRHLILHGLDSTAWLVGSLAAVGVALVLIVLLLRYERRLVPRNVGNTLLVFRLAVLAAVFLVLLQPTFVRELDRERTGRIIVALDLSESTETTDVHATNAEKLRWARALGMIGNPSIDARLDRWIGEYEAGREPDLVDDDETPDPERRRQLAEVRRENLDAIFAEIDRVPRREIARRLLTATPQPLLPELEKIASVDVSLFGGKSQSADPETLERLSAAPPAAILPDVSDLSQGLGAGGGAGGGAGAGAPVIGVVLLTDGRDNSGRDPVGAGRRLGLESAPVAPVVFGSRHRPRDISISAVDYPQTVFKDDKPVVKATLITAGFTGEPLEVVLEQTGPNASGDPPLTKTIVPDGPITQVEFELEADRLGRHEYVVRTDPRPDETRDDNNQKSLAINVVDDQASVLLIEGEARWEFRFIDNALSRDERAELDRVVFRQPYMGVLQDTFLPRRLALPADPADLHESPFAEADLVIVGDVAPEEFGDDGWRLLDKFVAEAGGTLVLVAGKQSLPLAHRSESLERLLPVTNLRPVNMAGFDQTGAPTERGFQLKLTPDGEREAMFQFDTSTEINREIWSSLPGHSWGLLGTAKPGATVYASAYRPGTEPSLEAERQYSVIVHQHYGFGQVLWLGIDSTWRWRHRVGDRYHHRFWGQLGRWAAENKAAAGNDFVKFGPERSDIEVGEDAVLRARWTQPFLIRNPRVKASVEVRRAGDASPRPFSTVELLPSEARPLVFEGRAVSLPPGEYTLTLVVENAPPGAGDLSTSLYVHERQTLELSDLSANPELLKQIADAASPTGSGRVFYPDEVAQIPALFRDPEAAVVLREETVLWDTWGVIALFFGLLTVEWVVRKLNGLP
ncbi:MAG TPA: hypothetical protein VML55_05910 [Planctomycetaceae bacterium]|nr:hypothetical protein [Planctomycetaceae bacterium]